MPSCAGVGWGGRSCAGAEEGKMSVRSREGRGEWQVAGPADKEE